MTSKEPDERPPETPSGRERLRALVAECLDRMETEGRRALERLCEAHPDQASALRRRVQLLAGTGLAGGDGGDFPERLGEFRLQKRLGQGGMGVVYLAIQERLGREVALKLVRPDQLYFPGARERFQREVEAVARIQHDGVVPVYTVGEEQGIPYFAMQFVRGCSAMDALQHLRHRTIAGLAGSDLANAVADVTGRMLGRDIDPAPAPLFAGSYVECCLRLTAEVSQALQHAHDRGILHRDLKPSNLMITPEGRVMLLDFGLAAADGSAPVTKSGSWFGSLPYTPPEHLAGEGVPPGPRSDVYSLGVTLYELLTCENPFLTKGVEGTMQRVLEGRFEPARTLNPDVPRDVETVLAKALERERHRRYATAAEFGRDLTNILEKRPIAARRSTPFGRSVRWVQRHPAGATAAALGALLCVGAPLGFAFQQHAARREISGALAEAERQQRAAEFERSRAEENLRTALSAVDRMLTRVGYETLADVPEMEPVREQLLKDALALYSGFLEQNGGSALLQVDLALAEKQCGTVLGLLGKHEEAVAALRSAAARFEALRSERTDAAGSFTDIARCYSNAANNLVALGRPDEAERDYRRALEEIEATLAAGTPEAAPVRIDRLTTSSNLALLCSRSGRSAEAHRLYRVVLDGIPELLPLDNEHRSVGQVSARANTNLGQLLAAEGDRDGAHRHHAAAVEAARELYARKPESAEYCFLLATCLVNAAAAFDRPEDADRREELDADARLLLEGLTERFPSNVVYARTLALVQGAYGTRLGAIGRIDEAIAQYTRACEAFRRIRAQGSAVPDDVISLSKSLNGLARLHWGNFPVVDQLVREAVDVLRELCEQHPDRNDARQALENAKARVLLVLRASGRAQLAVAEADLIANEFADRGLIEFHRAMCCAAAAMEVRSDPTRPAPERELRAAELAARGLARLREAAAAGFADGALLDTELGIGELSVQPDYAAIRARIAANALER